MANTSKVNFSKQDYRKAKSGYVYFAKAYYEGEQVIKIGYTTKWNVQERISELCEEYGLNLKLWFYVPGNISDEKAIHREYSSFNVKNYYHKGNLKKELFWFEGDLYYFCQSQYDGRNQHVAAAYDSVKGFTDNLHARDLESCLKANRVINEGKHPLEDDYCSRDSEVDSSKSTKKTSVTTVASACILGVIVFMTSFAFGARQTPSPAIQETPATTQSF